LTISATIIFFKKNSGARRKELKVWNRKCRYGVTARCLAIEVFVVAGMCLATRCLAVGRYVTLSYDSMPYRLQSMSVVK
jgi:hypothetical protein